MEKATIINESRKRKVCVCVWSEEARKKDSGMEREREGGMERGRESLKRCLDLGCKLLLKRIYFII